jgi:hypothetical protein
VYGAAIIQCPSAQDLLWSVRDQIAVPHILAMTHNSWCPDAAAV